MGKKGIAPLSRRIGILFALVLSLSAARAQMVSSPPVHDPVMIRQDSTYYVFCTGRGITVWSSTNRWDWTQEPPVFSEPPHWAQQAIPGFRGQIWAPDISYHNGKYYLYYAVS